MDNRRSKYREVFDTPTGIEVLNDIGIMCGFFEDSLTLESMALSNLFRMLLEQIGILDGKYIARADIIRKLMELPLMPEDK